MKETDFNRYIRYRGKLSLISLIGYFLPYPLPTKSCLQTFCTGCQTDNILHCIQHKIPYKMIYNNLGTSGGATEFFLPGSSNGLIGKMLFLKEKGMPFTIWGLKSNLVPTPYCPKN